MTGNYEPGHVISMSQPVTISVLIGNQAQDYQAGNLLNAIDEVVEDKPIVGVGQTQTNGSQRPGDAFNAQHDIVAYFLL